MLCIVVVFGPKLLSNFGSNLARKAKIDLQVGTGRAGPIFYVTPGRLQIE